MKPPRTRPTFEQPPLSARKSASWPDVRRIFTDAIELPPARRDEFLADVCGADNELRDEVRALLAAHDALGTDGSEGAGFLARLDAGRAVALLDAGRVVGPYRIIRELGRGGMAAVYLGERADGQFQQLVALKLIKRGMDSDEIHRRFIAERQILAQLGHPHIARLLDGGVTDDGQPWFAMEYVDGTPITVHCDTRSLPVSERLRLFRDVCDAVRFAHANLVVHRDLKPSNVLVTNDGTVTLLDFGIAKVLREEPAEGARGGETHARISARVMTPAYAAPEQVRGEPVTTATDVYSLGVLLYELLTGHRVHRFAQDAPADVERAVCDIEPDAPSVVVTQSATTRDGDAASAARGTTPDRLRRQLAGDLDAIVLGALKKDPARRYPTVDALLADLERYSSGMPVRVRAASARYRVGKFVRRHRVAVVAAVAVLVSLVAGMAGTVWQARAAARQAANAARAAARATAAKEFLAGTFTQADPSNSHGDSLTASAMLDRAGATIDSAFAGEPDIAIDLLVTLGRIYRDLGRVASAESLLTRAVALAGRTHPGRAETAHALAMLGSVQLGAGKLQSADSVATRALAILARLPGEDSVLALTLDMRGSVQRRLNQFAASESSYRAAIVAASRAQVNSLEIAGYMGNLSVTLHEAGDRQEGEAILKRVIGIQRRHAPPNYPSLVLSLNNLASRMGVRWQLDSAIPLAEDVLQRQRRLYPGGHERVAMALNNLAYYHMDAGRFAVAESMFREAVHVMERQYGSSHLSTLICLNNVGRALLGGGDAAAAEAIFRHVLGETRRTLGNGHAFVTQSLLGLGRAHAAQGRPAAARAALDTALSIAERLLPPKHPRPSEVRSALGAVHLLAGRPADAEAVLRPALAWRLAHLAPRDPGIGETTVLLARARAERGARAEAESLYTDGIRRLEGSGYRARAAEVARREFGEWQARWR